MTQTEMKNLGIAAAILFAAYKFGPHPAIKAGAIAVGAVIVAKRVPFLSNAI